VLFFRFLYLIDGKRTFQNIWDMLLFSKRTFTDSEDITIPADKSLILHSPKIDGELKIDGEGYIL
jgi:hypothetical protein